MAYNTRYHLLRVMRSEAYDAPTLESRLKANDAPPFGESWSWYEHEADIARAMRESGSSLVVLHGDGEEVGDVWDKEFRVVGDAIVVETYRFTLSRPEAPTSTATIKEI